MRADLCSRSLALAVITAERDEYDGGTPPMGRGVEK